MCEVQAQSAEALRDALIEHNELIDEEIIEVIEAAEQQRRDEIGEVRVVDLRGEKPVVDTRPNTETDEAPAAREG